MTISLISSTTMNELVS